MLDCRGLPINQLASLLDQAHDYWKQEVCWALLNEHEPQSGNQTRLPVHEEPFRLVHPLTSTKFLKLCQFLTETEVSEDLPNTTISESENGTSFQDVLKNSDLKVLVAEDDPINQKLIHMFLKKSGCVFQVVPDGEMALERIKTESYDVVLMDCNLPGLSGLETTRRIRAHDEYDDMVIIATTANALKGHREKCFDAGMNDFMVKPLDLDLLTVKLARIADRGSILLTNANE